MKTTEYDEIRPYHDEELPFVYDQLEKDETFKKVMGIAFPELSFEQFMTAMRGCERKIDFQLKFCLPFLDRLIEQSCNELKLDTTALEDISNPYTFISNHRDIVLDSAFLSYLLIKAGANTAEEAIGDNLLIYPWIKHLVRINKSFIVQRAASMKQMMLSSQRLSRYIHYTINDKKQSIWIAQREGRAKDSNDRTQVSLLKMLAMSGEGTIKNRLKELHIVPLAISYEYDPCDYLKAMEMQLKRDSPSYKKMPKDDLMNMQVGILGYKGRVNFVMGRCLDQEIALLEESLSKKEYFSAIVALIDREIHRNYVFYPINYIAADVLEQCEKRTSYYTKEDKAKVEDYLRQRLAKIDIPHKDEAFLYQKIIEMYANPLLNNEAL
jgi:hypothetical protein